MAEPAIPTIPLTADGRLVPLPLLLRWLAGTEHETIALEQMPFGNGCLPGILRLAGVREVRHRHPAAPDVWAWEGLGGGRVLVRSAVEAVADDPAPVHQGTCPVDDAWPGHQVDPLRHMVDLARIEDAAAILSGGVGAAWDHLLSLIDDPGESRIPPVTGQLPVDDGSGVLRAWNPLPMARTGVVALPKVMHPAPWAVRDPYGRCAPVQVVEGPVGTQLLTVVTIGALECMDLEALDEPMPGSFWEISEKVIDNGRLRAELDRHGLITRLCIDGRFQPLTAPAPMPLVGGIPSLGASTIRVLESGPVRARIAVTIDAGAGQVDLVYSLHAEAAWLGVTVGWAGDPDIDLILDHPTTWRGGDLRLGYEAGCERLAQARSLFPTRPAVAHGAQWAWLGDTPGDEGLALAARHPCHLRARGGHLQVLTAGHTAYALADARRARGDPSLPQLALALAHPVRAAAGHATPHPPILRLADADDLVPLWIRRLADGRTEMVLAECHGHRGRALLFPLDRTSKDAHLVNLRGAVFQSLEPSPEGDAWMIDYQGDEVLVIRW